MLLYENEKSEIEDQPRHSRGFIFFKKQSHGQAVAEQLISLHGQLPQSLQKFTPFGNDEKRTLKSTPESVAPGVTATGLGRNESFGQL